MYRADYEQTAADLNLTRGGEVVRSVKEVPHGCVRVWDLQDPGRFYKLISRGLLFHYDVRVCLDQKRSGALYIRKEDARRIMAYWARLEFGGKRPAQKPIHFKDLPVNSELAILEFIGQLNQALVEFKKPWWKRIFRKAA